MYDSAEDKAIDGMNSTDARDALRVSPVHHHTKSPAADSPKGPFRVEESRTSLARDIPSIPAVTLQSLVNAILPDVSTGRDNLDGVCRDAISRGFITESNSISRWNCLPRDLKSVSQDKPLVSGFVLQIFDQIRGLLSSSQPLVECLVDGDNTPFSERGKSSRPDNYRRSNLN